MVDIHERLLLLEAITDQLHGLTLDDVQSAFAASREAGNPLNQLAAQMNLTNRYDAELRFSELVKPFGLKLKISVMGRSLGDGGSTPITRTSLEVDDLETFTKFLEEAAEAGASSPVRMRKVLQQLNLSKVYYEARRLILSEQPKQGSLLVGQLDRVNKAAKSLGIRSDYLLDKASTLAVADRAGYAKSYLLADEFMLLDQSGSGGALTSWQGDSANYVPTFAQDWLDAAELLESIDANPAAKRALGPSANRKAAEKLVAVMELRENDTETAFNRVIDPDFVDPFADAMAHAAEVIERIAPGALAVARAGLERGSTGLA